MSEQSSKDNSAEQNPQDAVKPWTTSQSSGSQASTVPGQYSYLGAANQTEAPIAVTTVYPKFPLRWLYGVRIAFMMVSLGMSVWSIYNIVEFIAEYGFKYWDAEYFLHVVLTCAFLVYYSLQILAAIFYLKSKALGFILSINIIGLFLQGTEVVSLIKLFSISLAGGSFQYTNGLGYLNWGLYFIDFIDVALCIVFIFVTVREYSRRRKNKTV
ncbi:hypothetical protein [Rothia aeria]|jgi:hypothetical protein|uniref:hypothetical protein n=1 Tax=Rothia aeria TaxID=172042 RepID=UPI00254B5A01|nr:hypothetical protein [Rothia aeria]MDK7351923.1 hypothetical protein [Rothia aeria]